MFRRIALAATVVTALSGCSVFATCSVGVGALHMSEPLRGRPLESARDSAGRGREDVLDAARVPLKCTSADGRVEIENTLMYNLRGKDGGGIYGDPFIYTLTVDYKLKEWRP